MNRSVERCVFAGLVRQHCIFLEAPPRVVGIALEDNVGAKSEVVRNIAPIPIDGGRDLGDTSFFERAAITFRLTDFGKLKASGWRKAETIRLRQQTRRVAHWRHFDARLGSVYQGVEYFWIDDIVIRTYTI